MKKALLFLNMLFLVLFLAISPISFFFTGVVSVENDNQIVERPISDDYSLLINYVSQSTVYKDKIGYNTTIRRTASMPLETLSLYSEDLKIGDIIEKDEVINNFVVPYDMRIRSINGNQMVVENLSKTYIDFPFSPTYKVYDQQNLSFSVKYFGKNFEVLDYSVNYSTLDGGYLISLHVKNGGYLLNGADCTVTVVYALNLEGLFVESSYIYGDGTEFFVYKLFNINRVDYYKKIKVEILDVIGTYSKVSGALNEKNVIFAL
jgi:hypothetical protein